MGVPELVTSCGAACPMGVPELVTSCGAACIFDIDGKSVGMLGMLWRVDLLKISKAAKERGLHSLILPPMQETDNGSSPLSVPSKAIDARKKVHATL
eukprot:1155032-Pelagomonas_calceolata.AAC.1